MEEETFNIGHGWYKKKGKKKAKATRQRPRIVARTAFDLPHLMTMDETASALRRHRKTVDEWALDGSLRTEKIRGRRFTTPSWIADFINQEFFKK